MTGRVADMAAVRDRLELAFAINGVGQAKRDVCALLADHARLQASHDRLLKAAQYLQSRVVETRGIRCMDEMHAAIDAAKAVQP